MQFLASKVKYRDVETWKLIFITSYPQLILMLFICGPHIHYILKSASYFDHYHCPQYMEISRNLNKCVIANGDKSLKRYG